MVDEILCVSECDDCGYGFITDPEFVTILDFGDSYSASTVCQFCERPIVCEITGDLKDRLVILGVKMFGFDIDEKS